METHSCPPLRAHWSVPDPGLDPLLEDDNGARNSNSRIAVTFRDWGTCRLIASAFSSGSGGPFDICVTTN